MQNRPGPDWDRVQEVFLATLDLPSEEQPAYLDAACGADVELRAEVESLLRAGGDEKWLTSAVGSQAFALLRGSPLAGTRLGVWRVLRQARHEGFGEVYLAERADDESHKQVAIKVVKLATDTADIL